MKTLCGLVLLGVPMLATADVVVPIESVQSFVNVRSEPLAGTDVVGRLNRGDELQHLRTVDGWHEIELPDGGTGYVHSDWANVVVTALDGTPVIADTTASGTAIAADAPVSDDGATAASEESTAMGPDASAADSAAAEAESTLVETDAVVESDAAVADRGSVSEGSVNEVSVNEDSINEGSADEDPVVEETVATVEADSDTELVVEEAAEPVVQATPVNTEVSTLKGRKDFIVRFKDESTGTSSQIFDDGNFVGIGTTAPQQRLEVNGSIQVHDQNSGVAGLMITQSSGDTGYILHNRASTLTIGAGSIDRVTIDRNGNVGFGVSRPEHPLQLSNGAYVTAGGVWANSSSRLRKHDIADLDVEQATRALIALQPVSFKYKNDALETYLGFIAEDVPAMVARDDRQSLSTMDIVAVLTKVVQDQQQRIERLEARLEQRD